MADEVKKTFSNGKCDSFNNICHTHSKYQLGRCAKRTLVHISSARNRIQAYILTVKSKPKNSFAEISHSKYILCFHDNGCFKSFHLSHQINQNTLCGSYIDKID